MQQQARLAGTTGLGLSRECARVIEMKFSCAACDPIEAAFVVLSGALRQRAAAKRGESGA
ncbi:hypothetical protein C0Z18_08955 [Trinickia dabaoshanensis]|uniref:Uncharacterized protein n=1 Tax=Trinickia dabaoshanensis TaxID=564714 RepID=A0A2N7VVV8_9BURK|nr:hypothetical protein C0Z18_08955 [Trinickia dabaoshanensis]